MMPKFYEENMGKFGLAFLIALVLAGLTFVAPIHALIGDNIANWIRMTAVGMFIFNAALVNLRTEDELRRRR